jgi:hypothetical protein
MLTKILTRLNFTQLILTMTSMHVDQVRGLDEEHHEWNGAGKDLYKAKPVKEVCVCVCVCVYVCVCVCVCVKCVCVCNIYIYI